MAVFSQGIKNLKIFLLQHVPTGFYFMAFTVRAEKDVVRRKLVSLFDQAEYYLNYFKS